MVHDNPDESPPSYPALRAVSGPDRLPPPDPATYDEAQRIAAAALVASPRGAVRGPFVPMLRSAVLLDRTQQLGAFLRYDCSIPERLREWAIIVTARWWNQAYEWHIHVPLALKAGVGRETIAALRDGAAFGSIADDERVVHDFCLSLHATRFVPDGIYAAATSLLGERGVVELTGLCGYYALLAMQLNVARTPVPGPSFAVPG